MIKTIINADDFGLNLSCTKAICQAFQENMITDTTLVANGLAFDEAVEDIKKYNLAGKVGIHFNLTEGKPLTSMIASMSKFTENGIFHGKINRVKRLSKNEKQAVYKELSAQIQRLEQAGIDVNHADSHHHIHTAVFIAPVFVRVCKEHGIKKIRLHRNIGSIPLAKRIIKKLYNKWLHYEGFYTTDYFGAMQDVELVGLKNNLEIMVHPEFDMEGTLIDKKEEQDGCNIGEQLLLPVGQYELRGYIDL